MKKIALALALGLMINSLPVKAFASFAGPGILSGGGGGAVAFGLFALGLFGNPESKGPQTEFEALNSNPRSQNLLTQSAGGSLNTVDILK